MTPTSKKNKETKEKNKEKEEKESSIADTIIPDIIKSSTPYLPVHRGRGEKILSVFSLRWNLGALLCKKKKIFLGIFDNVWISNVLSQKRANLRFSRLKIGYFWKEIFLISVLHVFPAKCILWRNSLVTFMFCRDVCPKFQNEKMAYSVKYVF